MYRIKVVENKPCEKKIGWYICEYAGELQVTNKKKSARQVSKERVDNVLQWLTKTYPEYLFRKNKVVC